MITGTPGLYTFLSASNFNNGCTPTTSSSLFTASPFPIPIPNTQASMDVFDCSKRAAV
ncbi:hypothetical protein Hdeb2414_s0016g00491781 [Helianthus debilis subsp. tardiflorus]